MDKNNNIFAPPTQDELELHDTEVVEPSQLEALGRGALQGGSFGFSDEATAALESAFTPKTYDQALQESRAAYKAAEEAHPITTLAGNIAGGIPAGGMVLRGLKAASALPAAQKLLSLVKPGTSPSALNKLLQFGSGKVGQLAATGAIEGGLYGAGQAENMDTVGQDIASGAKTGAVLGGIGGAVAKGLGKLGSTKNKLEVIEDIQDAYKLGKKGDGLISQESQSKIRKAVGAAAGQVNSQIQTGIDDMAFLKDAILKNSPKTVDISNSVDNMWEKLAPYEGYPVIGEFKRAISGVIDSAKKRYGDLSKLPVSESNELKKHLDNFLESSYSGITPPEPVRAVIKGLREELRGLYQGIDYQDAQKAYNMIPPQIGQELVQKYPGVFQSKNPVKVIDDTLHNLLNATERAGIDLNTKVGKQVAAEKMSKVISNISKSSDAGRSAQMKMDDILGYLKKANPELAKQAEDIINPASRNIDLARAAAGQRAIGEQGAPGFLKSVTSKGAVTLSNLAGQGVKTAEDLTKFQSPETLSRMVVRANEKYGPKTAKILEETFANYTEGKPNAAMNALLQNPTFRQLMITDDNENNEGGNNNTGE